MLARTFSNNVCIRRAAHRLCHVRFSSTLLPSDTFEPSVYELDSLPDVHPNEGILNMLRSTIVAAEDDLNGGEGLNRYRITSFKRALQAVEETKTPIKSIDDAYKIQGVGEGIARRIALYLSGQHDPTLTDNVDLDLKVKDTALAAFSAIPGIGRTKSKKLIEAGCLTLQELQSPKNKSKLTHIQQMGLTYREHLQKPVTRTEAEAVTDFIRDQLPPLFEIHIVGNYRRNAPSSSTLELLLLHPSHTLSSLPSSITPYPQTPSYTPVSSNSSTAKSRPTAGRNPVFFRGPNYQRKSDLTVSFLSRRVVDVLERSGVLVQSTKKGVVKWTGVARVPKRLSHSSNSTEIDENGAEGKMAWEKMAGSSEDARYVHLEIKSVYECLRKVASWTEREFDSMAPIESRATALLALTGDVQFVKDLQSRARRMGLEVNEWGLWRSLRSGPEETDETQADGKGVGEVRTRGRPKGSFKRKEGEEEMKGSEQWERIDVQTEEEVLRELGMGWVEPARRNFGLLSSATAGGVRVR